MKNGPIDLMAEVVKLFKDEDLKGAGTDGRHVSLIQRLKGIFRS